MAKKEIAGYVKLQINGGQANPAPPVGPALGQRGINIMEFCKAFNEKTKAFMGKPVPVIIEITLKEANLKASRYGMLFELKYNDMIRTTKKTKVKNSLTWSSLIKFFIPFLVKAK